MLSRLCDAIVDGSDVDIEALRAAAIAEQQAAPKVSSAVSNSVLKRLREAYSPVAVENYAKMAKVFDSWATKFSATTAIVDVERHGADIVEETDRARKGWLDAQKFAARLSKLVPALHAAARLTGVVPESARRDSGGQDDRASARRSRTSAPP